MSEYFYVSLSRREEGLAGFIKMTYGVNYGSGAMKPAHKDLICREIAQVLLVQIQNPSLHILLNEALLGLPPQLGNWNKQEHVSIP